MNDVSEPLGPRIDAMTNDLERITLQLRVLINQSDKILEFMDALTEAMTAIEESEEPQPVAATNSVTLDQVIERLAGDSTKERGTDLPGWGHEAYEARKSGANGN